MADMKIGLNDALLSGITDKLKLAELQTKVGELQKSAHDAKRAEEAATQFEAILVQQMVESMFKAVPKGGLLSGSSEEQLFQEMLQKEVAEHIAEHQSFGIRDMVLEELKKRGEV